MENKLVIVESPAKAKTIKKFLGDDFIVKSSYGHIRDIEKKNLGIDIEHGFAPDYEIPDDKKKVVADLKEAAGKVKIVWLASDEDREGEAISWHLSEVLKLKKENTKRIVFHEITKEAIKNAIANPRDIDQNLVNAQQARRVLDRLVGFKLSPLLWKKIKPSLSAGRVQSVAVKLIVEREREITEFNSKSEYKVFGQFEIDGNSIKAELNKKFKTYEEAKKFVESCKDKEFSVKDVSKKPGKKSPAPPFTTSTLQQEAGRKLGYSVSQTMRYAQNLYENGFITYMRTDSLNLSTLAIGTIKTNIIKNYGEDYLHVRKYQTKVKGAQEAHEAIRPTFVDNETIEATKQEQRLYDLIRKRAIASQMADAKTEKTIVTIGNSTDSYSFIATGETIIFDGFLKLYIESTDDDNQEEATTMLPNINIGTTAKTDKIEAIEKYDQPPSRYTEASLVKKMEELGIGRPSTYAPTISTIQQREYVVKESKPAKKRSIKVISLSKGKLKESTTNENYGAESNKLFPTSIGIVVTDYLTAHFNDVLDYNFTAQIEEKFDNIAMGKLAWNDMLKSFYKSFDKEVNTSLKEKETSKWERNIGNDPKTGAPILIKIGKFGPYASIENGDKPMYASLRKNQNIENVTLEEVLDLFKLPREIGSYKDDTVTVALGKFGPYIRNNGKFYSLAKTDDPYSINIERAIEIIEEKDEKMKNALCRTFDEEPDMQILKGKFGPYISYQKKNYKIPKNINPEEITLEQCRELIQAAQEKKKK
ncbi:MAG: type I DNA topoisomerase [Bacteroidales bacterium]|nr:type I DNA topoisomerase [Bacteroidales bacterium]